MSASFRDFQNRSKTTFVWHKGDCLDLLPTIPDNSVQLVLTSPPYSVGKEYEKDIGISENLVFQASVLDECLRILKPNGSICWQVANTYEKSTNSRGLEISEQIPWDILLYKLFVTRGLKLRNRIIWQYEHGTHAQHRFSNRYESIMWFTKGDDYIFNLDDVRVPQKHPDKKAYKGPNRGKLSCNPKGKNPGDVWPITNVKHGHSEKAGSHPCQFPEALADRCIKAFSNPGDIVVDPFGGSATTLISALKLKRTPIGAEINPQYHSEGAKRIKSIFGGKSPERVKGWTNYYILNGLAQKVIA